MDKLEFAIQVMLIGFGVVMFTLLLLYLILHLFSIIFRRPKPEKTVINNQILPTQPVNKENKEKEKVAAIMAAVYQYMAIKDMTVPAGGYKMTVTSEQGNADASWVNSGRKRLLEQRNALETIRRHRQGENI